MKINIIFIASILIFISFSCATTSNMQYEDAIKEIDSGNIAFGFMKLRNYLYENPDSIHAQKIRFAICEYYYQVKDYRDCLEELIEYLTDYPKEENSIFAQAILYKVLSEYENYPLLDRLKELLFAKSVFLVFSESKTKSYKSILNNNYKIADYVDKIEVFKNNELFLKVTP